MTRGPVSVVQASLRDALIRPVLPCHEVRSDRHRNEAARRQARLPWRHCMQVWGFCTRNPLGVMGMGQSDVRSGKPRMKLTKHTQHILSPRRSCFGPSRPIFQAYRPVWVSECLLAPSRVCCSAKGGLLQTATDPDVSPSLVARQNQGSCNVGHAVSIPGGLLSPGRLVIRVHLSCSCRRCIVRTASRGAFPLQPHRAPSCLSGERMSRGTACQTARATRQPPFLVGRQ